MFVEERHEKILQLLHENGKVKVKDLSERFQVTEDCIRKDLASMEGKELLKRTYGGAVIRENMHPGHSTFVSKRKDTNTKEKQQIAKKAVKLIEDGEVIFLDISTTNIELAKEIIQSGKKVTVVSSMLDIANLFAVDTKASFILLGGKYEKTLNAYMGTLTLSMMDAFRFDRCFMGVVGADAKENAITVYNPEDGIIKQNAVKRSRKVYLMMEKKKFGFQANYVYSDFYQVDGIICEERPQHMILEALEKYQVPVI
jgi:DeoR/GlpR family transcriptional regulator of sugar metabolism